MRPRPSAAPVPVGPRATVHPPLESFLLEGAGRAPAAGALSFPEPVAACGAPGAEAFPVSLNEPGVS